VATQVIDINKIDRNIKYVPKEIDRLSGNLQVCYEHPGSGPVPVIWRFGDTLETYDDEPYIRRIKAESDWKALIDSHCWVKKKGLVIVCNMAGSNQLVHPTEEEQKTLQDKIVEIKAGDFVQVVRAGRPAIFEPQDHSALQVRSLSGIIELQLAVMPR
jgi:hypothetical protein